MSHPLDSFERYANDLDDLFDDCLIVEYINITGTPTFKIMYDSSVNQDDLLKEIPDEWTQLEKDGKITLDIREYTTDCPEHKEAEYITQVLMKDHRDDLMKKLENLREFVNK